MGQVYLGADPTGALVALKLVHPGLAHDARFRSRFRQEVEVSRKVTGPWVAAVVGDRVRAGPVTGRGGDRRRAATGDDGASAGTSTGVVIGTPAFMSPEQITGDEVGTPSDVFSLGSVLVYAATGRGPFDAYLHTQRELLAVTGP